MKKTYHLTVYLIENIEPNVAYAIAEKSFTDQRDMMEFCAAFYQDDFELLFDVWTEEDGQVNINAAVGLYKESIEKLAEDFH